jgi:hypothetical protein
MNVFIVATEYEDGSTVLGVFSNFELALAEVNMQKQNEVYKDVEKYSDNTWIFKPEYSSDNLVITKTKLDKGSHSV